VARSKRRGMRRRSSAGKVDWVYRNDIWVDEANVSWGGWGGKSSKPSMSNLPSGAQSMILLDSVNFLRQMVALDWDALAGADAGVLAAAARPDYTRQPTAVAVQGTIMWRTGTWALGERQAWGVRLGWYEQDQDTGLLSLEPDYTIYYVGGGTVYRGPAIMANDIATHIKTWHVWQMNTSTDSAGAKSRLDLFWKGRRRAPSEKHCLALYIEGMDMGGYVAPIFECTQVRALIQK